MKRYLKQWLCSVLGHRWEPASGSIWYTRPDGSQHTETGVTELCRRCNDIKNWSVEAHDFVCVGPFHVVGVGVYVHDFRMVTDHSPPEEREAPA